MKTFTQKMLEAHITLGSGTFSSSVRPGEAAKGSNTKIVRLGMDVSITKPGGKEKNKATVRIFNLPLADMEILTTLEFAPLSVGKNVIAIYAGDENGLSLAFSGDIVSAVPDFNSAPDPVFNISCITGYLASIKAVRPLTAPGHQSSHALFQSLADQMGLTLVDRGADVQLRNLALMGGPMEQAQALAKAARRELIVDDGEMIVKPVETLREEVSGNTPVWSETSGLLGYPGFDQKGVVLRGIYEPKLKLGGPIKVESLVPRASGVWRITSLTHTLQANYPGAGAWESSVHAAWQQG